jgi:hypothetical protein
MAKVLPVEKSLTNPRFEGPYVVVKKLGPWTYELDHKITKKKIVRNHHHVKTCPANLDSIINMGTPSITTKHISHSVVSNVDSNQPAAKRTAPRKRVCPDRYGFVRRGEVL